MALSETGDGAEHVYGGGCSVCVCVYAVEAAWVLKEENAIAVFLVSFLVLCGGFSRSFLWWWRWRWWCGGDVSGILVGGNSPFVQMGEENRSCEVSYLLLLQYV